MDIQVYQEVVSLGSHIEIKPSRIEAQVRNKEFIT